MMRLSHIAKALVIVGGLMFAANGGAHAQTAPAADSGGGFDGYRAMAVTAGIIGGAVVATIATDGLIIPIYAWATGTPAAGMGGMAAGGGAAVNAAVGAARNMAGHGYQFFRGSMRLLGAVSGGFIADDWYIGN